MQRPLARMVEEGRPCPWVLLRPSWTAFQRLGFLGLFILLISCLFYCVLFRRQQQTQLEPLEAHLAELQLNLTVPRTDLTLRWGWSNLGKILHHGPALRRRQLRIRRDGIYRLHIQVTLANCSSATAVQPRATVTVSICSPATASAYCVCTDRAARGIPA
ncbi:hypothetical protein STEG23_009162 [Scotinomys teguina]